MEWAWEEASRSLCNETTEQEHLELEETSRSSEEFFPMAFRGKAVSPNSMLLLSKIPRDPDQLCLSVFNTQSCTAQVGLEFPILLRLTLNS